MRRLYKTEADLLDLKNRNDNFKYVDFNDIIIFINGEKVELPQSPKKPYLDTKHTSEDVLKYSEKLKEYELLNESYKELSKEIHTHNGLLENLLENILKEQAFSYSKAVKTDKLLDKVWSFAYSEKHSDGLREVYTFACDLHSLISDINEK